MTHQAEAGSVVAEQPAGNLAQPTATADNGSAADAGKSWFDGLSEGNRKLAENKGWTTPDGVEKALSSYAELERQQGESLRVPAQDAATEEWDKFYSKLPEAMRPVASADKIEFKRPESLPENLPYDDALAAKSKDWMVEAKVTPAQAQLFHDKFAGHMAELATAHQAAIAKSVEETHDNLVKDWGPVGSAGFNEKQAVADRAIKKLGLADAFKEKGILLPDGALTSAQIALAFEAVGQAMFKEDTLGDERSATGGNPFKRDAKGELNVTAISALIQNDPERAKRMIREAGESEAKWMPTNPR